MNRGSRIYPCKTRVNIPSRFESAHWISPIVCRIAIFWVLLAGTGRAEEGSVLPLPSGRYRLEMIMTTVSRLPFFGSSKSASKSVSLVEVRRAGADLVQTHQVCAFHVLEDSALIKMIFPDKFVAALAKPTYSIQIKKDGQGWYYRADLGMERIGYRSNGADSKLPTKIDDPAVYDWDGDGHPGATLKLSVPLLPEGELYVVQRGHSLLSGRINSPARIDGGIEVRSFEHRVLGARPSFLNRSPEIEPDPKGSRFSMNPVPPGTTCEPLRKAESSSVEGAPQL
ncbi:MAG TPA: hypothetical protein VEG60_13615 [Candidatus Binatia bacterium]|nr:hypothetical protein [Candidatus Binatia bacterium]